MLVCTDIVVMISYIKYQGSSKLNGSLINTAFLKAARQLQNPWDLGVVSLYMLDMIRQLAIILS